MLLIDFLWSKRFPVYVELSEAAPNFLNPFHLVFIVELQNIIVLTTSTECTKLFQELI